jgi:hypothetical protein
MIKFTSTLFILLVSGSLFGQWTSGTILEKLSRYDAEFIDAENILIAGGQVWNNTSGNSNLSNNAYTYNVNTHTWGIQAMNFTRLEPITVRGDSGVYVIGGVSNWNQQPWVLTPTMELYNNGAFTLSSIPFQTIEGNAVAINGKIIVAPGANYWHWYSDAAKTRGNTKLWIYDEASKTWSSRHTVDSRFYSSAVTDGNIAIFAGGLTMDTTQPSNYLDGFSVSDAYDIYDGQTDTWTTGNLPAASARARISACHCNGFFVFAGGATGHLSGSSRINIFDGSNWTSANLAGSSRAIEDCATAGNKILFSGGGNWNFQLMWGNGNIVSRIDVFDSQDTSFSFMNLDRPLMDFKTPGYGGKAAVIGGTSFPGGNYTQYNTVKVYEDLNWINSIRNNNLLDFTIFPNPNNGFFNLNFNSLKLPHSIAIYNIMGEEIFFKLTNGLSQYTIDISDKAKGIYLIELRDKNNLSIGNRKIIIE